MTTIPPNEEEDEGAIDDAMRQIEERRNERERRWRRPVCLSSSAGLSVWGPGVIVASATRGDPLIGSPWEAAGWMAGWLTARAVSLDLDGIFSCRNRGSASLDFADKELRRCTVTSLLLC